MGLLPIVVHSKNEKRKINSDNDSSTDAAVVSDCICRITKAKHRCVWENTIKNVIIFEEQSYFFTTALSQS